MNLNKIILSTVTVILTSVTILCIHASHTHNRPFDMSVVILCLLNTILIVYTILELVDYTKTKSYIKLENWAYIKWDRIGFEDQQSIRQLCGIVFFLVMIGLFVLFILRWRRWNKMNGDNKILTLLLLISLCTISALCWVIANIGYPEYEIIKTPWAIILSLYVVAACCGFGIGYKLGDKWCYWIF